MIRYMIHVNCNFPVYTYLSTVNLCLHQTVFYHHQKNETIFLHTIVYTYTLQEYSKQKSSACTGTCRVNVPRAIHRWQAWQPGIHQFHFWGFIGSISPFHQQSFYRVSPIFALRVSLEDERTRRSLRWKLPRGATWHRLGRRFPQFSAQPSFPAFGMWPCRIGKNSEVF